MNIRVRRWITTGIILLLAALLLLVAYRDRRTERRRKLAMEEVRNEAGIYESELAEIRSGLLRKKAELEAAADCGKLLVGYCMSSKEDISLIKEQAQEYGFEPVAVLDCTMEVERLEDILDGLQGEGYEIMLTGTPFSEEVLDTADRVRALLPEYGLDGQVSFLLRGSDDTEENLDGLCGRGYTGLARFDPAASGGLTEEGTPYITYSFLHDNSQLTGGIDLVIENKSAMIVVFDLNSVESGSLKEEDMATTLKYIQKQADKEKLVYSSVSAALEEIKAGDDLLRIRRQNYEEYVKEQQKRIDELEEKIHEVYSRVNEE